MEEDGVELFELRISLFRVAGGWVESVFLGFRLADMLDVRVIRYCA